MASDNLITEGLTGLEEVAPDILSLRTLFVNVVYDRRARKQELDPRGHRNGEVHRSYCSGCNRTISRSAVCDRI